MFLIFEHFGEMPCYHLKVVVYDLRPHTSLKQILTWHFKLKAIHIFVFIMHIMSLFLNDHSFEIKYQVFWKLREGSVSVVYYHPEVQSSSNNKEFSQKYYLEIKYIVTQSKF